MSIDRRLVAVAEIARPHGVRGELRLKVYNPETALVAKGRRVVVRANDDPTTDRTLRIVGVRSATQAVLVELEGIADRNAAEKLRGAKVLVPRSELPALEDGEFYAFDVEGARAELVDGKLVGTVRALTTYPTCDVLVIDTPDGDTIELPLVDEIVEEVDPERHVVRLKSADPL